MFDATIMDNNIPKISYPKLMETPEGKVMLSNIPDGIKVK